MVRLALIAVFALHASVADASAPVRKSYQGCVVDGDYVAGRYVIRLFDRDRNRIDVTRFEGQRLAVTGDLLPGDILFVLDGPTPLGPCAERRPQEAPAAGEK